MSLWASANHRENHLCTCTPLESRLLHPDWDFQTPPPPLFKHSNKKSVTENAMLLAATNKQ